MATVLVIETHGPLMRLMSWFLLEAQHRVTAAVNMSEATRHARLTPRVIIFNTHMELAAKRQAIAELRALTPASKVLDVHDSDSPSGDTGADDYLSLPFDSYDLLAVVRKLAPS